MKKEFIYEILNFLFIACFFGLLLYYASGFIDLNRHWTSKHDHELVLAYNALLFNSGLDHEYSDHSGYFSILFLSIFYKICNILGLLSTYKFSILDTSNNIDVDLQNTIYFTRVYSFICVGSFFIIVNLIFNYFTKNKVYSFLLTLFLLFSTGIVSLSMELRTELIAMNFFLLSFICLIVYLEKKTKKKIIFFSLFFLFFYCAVLNKSQVFFYIPSILFLVFFTEYKINNFELKNFKFIKIKDTKYIFFLFTNLYIFKLLSNSITDPIVIAGNLIFFNFFVYILLKIQKSIVWSIVLKVFLLNLYVFKLLSDSITDPIVIAGNLIFFNFFLYLFLKIQNTDNKKNSFLIEFISIKETKYFLILFVLLYLLLKFLTVHYTSIESPFFIFGNIILLNFFFYILFKTQNVNIKNNLVFVNILWISIFFIFKSFLFIHPSTVEMAFSQTFTDIMGTMKYTVATGTGSTATSVFELVTSFFTSFFLLILKIFNSFNFYSVLITINIVLTVILKNHFNNKKFFFNFICIFVFLFIGSINSLRGQTFYNIFSEFFLVLPFCNFFSVLQKKSIILIFPILLLIAYLNYPNVIRSINVLQKDQIEALCSDTFFYDWLKIIDKKKLKKFFLKNI